MITNPTMAVASRAVRGNMAAAGMRRHQDRETSPERTKVWVEPKSKAVRKDVMVPVVYYLSRNGQLEHPHFMEVPLSSSDGLFLRDVMNRLNFLRGEGMANMYAWSSKRSYKSGFVWHDLSENDLVHPAQAHEYVLKGSELLLQSAAAASSDDSQSSISSFPDHPPATAEKDCGVVGRRRNQSWTNLDLAEYKVYKTSPAADASTQTDEKSRRRRRPTGRPVGQPDPDDADKEAVGAAEIEETELSRDEISPPPSSSSPETLEALIKADRRLVLPAVDGAADICDRTATDCPSGRMRASTILMQLISCGSVSVKDHGLSLLSHYKEQVSRVSGLGIGPGSGSESLSKAGESVTARAGLGGVRLEDKEYFSGSLIEANKGSVEVLPGLKRSSSYNADRSSMSDLIEEVGEDSRHIIKCIPRKLKSAAISKLSDISSSISRSTHGSKRISEDLK